MSRKGTVVIDAGVEPWEQGPGLLESLWKHRWLVVLAAIVAGVAGYYLSTLQPTSYEATAEVVLRDASSVRGVFDDGGRPPDAERRLLKEADRIVSRPVLLSASEALGLGGDAAAERLAKAVEVTAAVEQDSITVTATAPGPTLAASRANAIVESYDQLVTQRAVEEAEIAAAELRQRTEPIEARIEDLQAQLAANPDDVSAQVEQSAEIDQLTALETRARELAVNAALYGSGIEYIEPALVPEEPISPNPARNAALLAFLGLAVASAYAWWREGRTFVAESSDDPAAVLHAPLLGQVPDFGPTGVRALFDTSSTPPLLSDLQVEEAGSEAYHFIATSLEFALGDTGQSTALLTSATPDEGKTITVLNTALAAAGEGRRVLVIDADGRKRSLTRLAGLESAAGFSDFVAGDVGLESCLHDVAFGLYEVTMMPAGTPLAHPAGLFRSRGLGPALEHIKQNADLVLIDSPAALAVADTVALAGHADVIALVVNRGSRLAPLESLRDRLRLAGTPVVGYIFNRADDREVPYEYYGSPRDNTLAGGAKPPGRERKRRPTSDSDRDDLPAGVAPVSAEQRPLDRRST